MKAKGFSLVEVLISFALLIFLLIGTAHLTLHALLIKKKAEENLKIAKLIALKLESLKAKSFEDQALKEGTYEETVESNGKEKFRLVWAIEDIHPRLKRVRMEIYPEIQPQRKSQLVFILSRDLGF